MKFPWFKFLIVFAIVIRVMLAMSTYHQDLGAFALSGKYIAGEGKWLSFYDAIASKDTEGNMVVHRDDIVFNYQPLAYLIPSVVYLPFYNAIRQSGELFKNSDWISSNSSNFNLMLLIYKLPMLMADIFILWFIQKFFSKKNQKRNAQLLWALNPIAIYVSSMMGQVDMIIALLILVSLYFAKEKKIFMASVFVALSALIKPIGLILIPIFVIHQYHQDKNILKSFLVGVTGIGVYIFGILPYITSASYRYYALFADQINKSTYAGISIASGHDIPYFFILFVFAILAFWSKKIDLKTALLTVLLSSLAFTHFHPQWLIWLIPLAIIINVKAGDYFFLLVMTLCWIGVLFSFDETLHLQMFIHSRLAIPTSVISSSMLGQLVQISRAGLIAILAWLITIRKQKMKILK